MKYTFTPYNVHTWIKFFKCLEDLGLNKQQAKKCLDKRTEKKFNKDNWIYISK